MPKMQLVYEFTELPKFIKDFIVQDSHRGLWSHYIHDAVKPMSEYRGGEILRREPHYINGEDWIVERGDDPVSDWFYDKDPTVKEVHVNLDY